MCRGNLLISIQTSFAHLHVLQRRQGYDPHSLHHNDSIFRLCSHSIIRKRNTYTFIRNILSPWWVLESASATSWS